MRNICILKLEKNENGFFIARILCVLFRYR